MPQDWIKFTQHGTTTVVAPSGEIAYQQASEFRTALRKAFEGKPAKLVVDLSLVDYMNSPGLATLVDALKTSTQTKVPMILCGLNDKVRAIFEIARLHTVFKIVPSVEVALA